MPCISAANNSPPSSFSLSFENFDRRRKPKSLTASQNTCMPSIIYSLRLIPQVGENGAAREPCQRRRRIRRPKAYAEGLRRRLAGGRSPQGGREGGREGGIAENAAAKALSEAKACAEGRRLAGGRSPEGGKG